MTHPSYIFRVGGIPQRPVVHLELGVFSLAFPNRIHQDVDGALGWCFCMAVKYGDTEDYGRSFLANLGILVQHSPLAI